MTLSGPTFIFKAMKKLLCILLIIVTQLSYAQSFDDYELIDKQITKSEKRGLQRHSDRIEVSSTDKSYDYITLVYHYDKWFNIRLIEAITDAKIKQTERYYFYMDSLIKFNIQTNSTDTLVNEAYYFKDRQVIRHSGTSAAKDIISNFIDVSSQYLDKYYEGLSPAARRIHSRKKN